MAAASRIISFCSRALVPLCSRSTACIKFARPLAPARHHAAPWRHIDASRRKIIKLRRASNITESPRRLRSKSSNYFTCAKLLWRVLCCRWDIDGNAGAARCNITAHRFMVRVLLAVRFIGAAQKAAYRWMAWDASSVINQAWRYKRAHGAPGGRQRVLAYVRCWA